MGIVATNAQANLGSDTFTPASTFIETVKYNKQDQTMDITFKAGSTIRYIDVPPITFLSFKTSPTHDAFYSRAIKGNLQSIKLINKNIGRQESSPLKKVRKERTLNAGLRKQESRNDRKYGTVNRAFKLAA